MFRARTLIDTKPTLLSLILFALIASLSIPAILPHITQQFELLHILLHIIGIGFASFLTIVATVAYRRIRTRRLLFTTIAFASFILSEVFDLIDAVWGSKEYWRFSPIEISHLILMFTLLMFALSVFRKD